MTTILRKFGFLALSGLALVSISCSEDTTTVVEEIVTPLEVMTISDLDATDENFTKFSFATGEVTDSETEWDLAFYSTSIVLNGGEAMVATEAKPSAEDLFFSASRASVEPTRNAEVAAYLATGLFDEITEVDETLLLQDGQDGLVLKTGDNKWYSYDGSTHIISPVPGKIIVIKTKEGNYAKIEITSYYQGNITPDSYDEEGVVSKFYNFKYVLQDNGTTIF
ncbi:MAG: hypothetical protein HRT66_12565 [Flavobacteriaceae bacterium]|nr:hypothetical protein [Flavobacteriaceae bacterium]